MKSITISLVVSLVVALLLRKAAAMPADHTRSFTLQQPDGSQTPPLYQKGDYRYTWMTDAKGYTVMEDPESGWYVYARLEHGELVSSDVRVGHGSPSKLGLEKNLVIPESAREPFGGRPKRQNYVDNEEFEPERRRRLDYAMCDIGGKNPDGCSLQGLIVLVRFSNHGSRSLPDPKEYETLFNQGAGSVNEVFTEMSYGRMVMKADVTPWIAVEMSEDFAAGDASKGQHYGRSYQNTQDTWERALQLYKTQSGVDYGEYDDDGNGQFDLIAFIHSGVDAAAGGSDCEFGVSNKRRIWSHKHVATLYKDEESGVTVGPFFVGSGVWAYNNAGQMCHQGGTWLIARVGVMAHEAGHFLGLPDLYDSDSCGLGSYDMMSDAWGWNGSQKFPMHLSAWSKDKLGWVEVIDITQNGVFTIEMSCESDKIYRISKGLDADEYFLIENRQPCGYDQEFGKAAGLAIWHVDMADIRAKQWDKSKDELVDVNTHRTQGVCENKKCPVHFMTALVQGEGKFNLERHTSCGSPNMLFKKSNEFPEAAWKINDNGVTLNSGTKLPEPNTKSYATGLEWGSGIEIEVLTTSQPFMQFKVTFTGTETRTELPDPAQMIPYTLSMRTDKYPNEISYFINDMRDYVLNLEGPPTTYPNNAQYAETVVKEEFMLGKDLLYHFCMIDSYGDGFSETSGDTWWALSQGHGTSMSSTPDYKQPNHFKAYTCIDFYAGHPDSFGKTENYVLASNPPPTNPPPTNPPPTNPPPTNPPPTNPPPTNPPPTNPPPSPTPATGSSNSGTVKITLLMVFDGYPVDNWWEIQDLQGNVIVGTSEGDYSSSDQYSVLTRTFDLPEGEQFRFVFYDAWGDGLTHTSGGTVITDINGGPIDRGYYALYYGDDIATGELIFANHNFGNTNQKPESEVHGPFVAREMQGVAPPPPTPTPGGTTRVPITLFMQLDKWPQDTFWKVTDSSGNIEDPSHHVPQGTYSGQTYAQVEVTLFLNEGQTYQLEFSDAWGDGLTVMQATVNDVDGGAVLSKGYYALYYGTSVATGQKFYENRDFGNTGTKPESETNTFVAQGVGGTQGAPGPTPAADASTCVLPVELKDYAFVVKEDVSIGSANFIKQEEGILVGGDLTTSSSITLTGAKSFVGGAKSSSWQINNLVTSGSITQHIDWERLEHLAESAQDWDDTEYHVIVMSNPGELTDDMIRGAGSGRAPGQYLLVVTEGDVTFKSTNANDKYLGVSILAPKSKVTLQSSVGNVDGWIVAKELVDSRTHGKGYLSHFYQGRMSCDYHSPDSNPITEFTTNCNNSPTVPIKYSGVGQQKHVIQNKDCSFVVGDPSRYCPIHDLTPAHASAIGNHPWVWQMCGNECSSFSGC